MQGSRIGELKHKNQKPSKICITDTYLGHVLLLSIQGRIKKLFLCGGGGEGGESKCRSPWLIDDRILKIKLAKMPQNSPKKTKFELEYKQLKRLFLEFIYYIRLSDKNSSQPTSQQKLSKKITHFTIQFRSKNLTHFTNVN